MRAGAAQRPKDSSERKYRLDSGVTLTRQRHPGAPSAAFVKIAASGRLLKLGAEEIYLLERLTRGLDHRRIVAGFAERFGKKLGPQAIERFRDQMIEQGVLSPVEDAEFDPQEGEDTPPPEPAPDAPPARGEIWPSDRIGGGFHDPELDDLEELIYSDRPPAPDRRSGPGTEATRPASADDGAPPRPPETDPGASAEADIPLFVSGRSAGGRTAAGTAGRTAGRDASGDTVQPGTGAGADDADTATAAAAPRDSARRRQETRRPPGEAASRPPGPAPELADVKIGFRDRLDAPPPRPPGMLRLFDPTPVLDFLARGFGWLRHADWLIYPLVLFAVLITLNRLSQYGLSLTTSFGAFSMIGVIGISLLTVNLFSVLIPAVAARRHGVEIRHFGFVFILFVIPRFAVDLSGLMLAGREARLAYHATAMKTRLFLFALATIVWALTRQSQTMLPDIAFVVSQIALLTFLLSAFPLIPGDGYKWLATWFDQPLLRQRAFHQVFGLHGKLVQNLPPPSSGEKLVFALYAIGSALVMGLVASLAAMHLTTALEGRFGGTGLLMFLGLLGAVALWITVMKRAYRKTAGETVRRAVARQVAGLSATGSGDPARGRPGAGLPVPVTGGGALVPRGNLLPDRPRQMPLGGVYSSARKSPWRWLWRGLAVAALAALVWAAFQPYTYETGGDFVILPDQRTKVSVRVEGDIVEIHVDEGDIVEPGQPLARLSDLDLRHRVATVEAELEKARAVLARLEAGATAEEIQVAREQVAMAEADLPFKRSRLERAEQLFERGTIAASELDARRSEMALAEQALRTAQANLARVEAPASPADIRVARSDIARLEAELDYQRQRLDNVVIRAPVTGKIVTENVRLMRGQHMAEGALFVEIENHEIARAEVRVPEADIGLVQPGDKVRLKAWASSTAERVGEVVAIAPQAEQNEFGRTVRVKTEFDNSEGFFRPGMTGYAKIEGAEMPSWQAFTRLVDRFFRIEVWGWIP